MLGCFCHARVSVLIHVVKLGNEWLLGLARFELFISVFERTTENTVQKKFERVH